MRVLSISFLVVLVDQVSKYMVRRYIGLGDQISVIPGLFNLTYVQNTGAAWGILAGFSSGLIVLSLIMLLVLIVFRTRLIENMLINEISLALMIAGIVGNLIDRIKLGYVVDFLDFYLKPVASHFPSFNVADSSICVGVGLYIISQLFQNKIETASELTE